eukprot:INCI456.1.p1 GENE.INCI456.1~~INCI456.1.p1  ORF type:complete len:980 (-),score=115.39 INCI456.1:580-3519(-)
MERLQGAVVGAVTALSFAERGTVILVGTASTIVAFSTGTGRRLWRVQPFERGEVIHGIIVRQTESESESVLAEGGKAFAPHGEVGESGSETEALVLVFADKRFALLSRQGSSWQNPPCKVRTELRDGARIASGLERADRIICASFLGFPEVAPTPATTMPVAGHSAKPDFAMGFFHNFVELWRPTVRGTDGVNGDRSEHAGLTLVGTCKGPTRCLVYSMDILRYMADETALTCRVASGTIFSDIVLWRANFRTGVGSVLHRLVGHNGVIFSARWSSDGRKIASVSDDRTVRLWAQQQLPGDLRPPSPSKTLPTRSPSNSPAQSSERSEQFECQFASFGHRARVWDVRFIEGQGQLVTVSEDATAKLWDEATGACLSTIVGHAPKNVWSIAVTRVVGGRAVVATGGADGSVKIWSSNHVTYLPRHFLDLEASAAQGQNDVQTAPSSAPAAKATIRDMSVAVRDDGSLFSNSLLFAISSPNVLTCIDPAISKFHVVYRGQPSDQFTKICCSRDTAAVGTARGKVLVFDLRNRRHDYPVDLVASVDAHKCRIRHLSNTLVDDNGTIRNIFVSCDANSLVSIWEIAHTESGAQVHTLHSSRVPTKRGDAGIISSTIMCTTEEQRSQMIVVLGDCYGHVHCLSFGKDTPESYFRLPSAHGRHPVAVIQRRDRDIVSAGHDGWIHFYELSIGNDGQPRLMRQHSMSTDSVAQIERIFWGNANRVLIGGFKSSEFVAVDLRTNCRVAQAACGGWKRPWDLFLHDPNDVHSLSFVCAGPPIVADTKSKSRLPRTAIQLYRVGARSNMVLGVGCLFHGQLVNCATWLQHETDGSCYRCVTCGEDGKIKLVDYNAQTHEIEVASPTHSTILCHSGAVRSCAFDSEHKFVFSAGARGQFCLTQLRAGTRPVHCDTFWFKSAGNELNQRCQCLAFCENEATPMVFAGDTAGCILCFSLTDAKIDMRHCLTAFREAPILALCSLRIASKRLV